MNKIVLPNTALCAIVRDEIMNPAGGIVDFIDSTVPFVEQAVVVDALSKDGTREVLEELQARYSHLQVFDRQFTGYADQRNYSLDKASARNVFILDADERLTQRDFIKLKEIMACSEGAWGYKFGFLEVTPEKPNGEKGGGHRLRLFQRSKEAKYVDCPWENLYLRGLWVGSEDVGVEIFDTGIKIKHFLPNEDSYKFKGTHWYCSIVEQGKASRIGPHDVPESQFWKAYNPARENFR